MCAIEAETEWEAAQNPNPRRNGFKRNPNLSLLTAGDGHARGPRTGASPRAAVYSHVNAVYVNASRRVGVGRGPRGRVAAWLRAAWPRGRGPRVNNTIMKW